jgi:two-component system phosphate regulon sensor histidine kinase PhoR
MSIDPALITQHEERLMTLRQQLSFVNTIGKRFVAANDRFQVHRALLETLRELYHFSACSILLEGDPVELTFTLSIIPCYPLGEAFIHGMIEHIERAAARLGFTGLTEEELAILADFDAPDELARPAADGESALSEATRIGDQLSIPLTVENRIIGMLSLFDEHEGAFDADLLQMTTMIADYAAVALENVSLREREMTLLRDAVLERQRLELIIGSMAEGLLITDRQGAITSLNASAQRLLSLTELTLPQDSLTPLRELAQQYGAAWIANLAEIVDQALTGKTVLNQEVIVGAVEDTVPLTLSVSAAPLYDTNALHTTLLGAVAVIGDITSHKQIDKLKDEFISIVSHELRTPLTAIKGYTQHLIRRVERRLREQHQAQTGQADLPESYDIRSLNIIQSQTDHLERLVNDLLDLSRVQASDLRLHYSSFYLADLLTECVRQAQTSAEQHAMQLDIDVQNSRVVADKVRIGQVIGNILDNAIKFSPQGGQVVVRLQEQGGDYLVSISDQGIGVNPEYFDHIFERFYRVRNMASRQYSGIGMGLYIAKVIVEAHEGRIWLTSKQGTGSTFYFTLPRVPHTSPLQA